MMLQVTSEVKRSNIMSQVTQLMVQVNQLMLKVAQHIKK